MTDLFPVKPGNVPPPPSSALSFQPLPSQSTHAFSSNASNTAASSGPGMRRRKHKDPSRPAQNLSLERVLGLTTASSNILATTKSQDLIAYAAGAVVVLYNHKRNKQVGFLYPPTSSMTPAHTAANGTTIGGPSSAPLVAISAGGAMATGGKTHMLSSSSFISPLGSSQTDLSVIPTANATEKKTPSTRAKPISCLAFSPDGNYLAAGEMGHQPRILIWDVKERVLLHECRGHKFGVLSLAFSPNNRYLVSIGFQHDGYLYVWHWRKGITLAGNKVTSKVNALSFSKDGTYFVTAGLRHVKYWYFDSRGRVPKRGNLAAQETQVLDGRSGILGVLRESNFVAVGCDRGTTGYAYSLTDSGILCMFKEGRVIDKWVDLQVQSAYSIAVSPTFVVCACAGGVIRLFEPGTLNYCGMLPKPHPLGIDISAITSPEMLKPTEENPHYYPDVIAVAYDDVSGKVTAVYSDRSLFLWDVRDLKKIGKYRSFIFHSDCVWGIEPSPAITDGSSSTPIFPPNSFATYSGDGTVRFWNIDHASTFPNSTPSSSLRSNTYSPLSPTKSTSAATQMTPSNSTSTTSPNAQRRNIYSRELLKMLYVDADAAEFSKFRPDVDVSEEQYPDFGIRATKMSSDGKLLVTGDRNGNLRVHNMETWEQITFQEAHDSEIMAIDITNPNQPDIPYMIATASRDRLIHVFDINNGFQVLQTLDDHSSSITAVKFTKNAKKLISCGADKGVIFRSVEKDEKFYSTYHNYSGRGTVFDMSLDVNDRYAATVTGERRLYVFNIDSGKPVRVCKPETAEESVAGTSAENSGGSLINIDLDPFSGTFAVTTGSDRCLRLFDLTNSTCIEKVCVHAELITAVKFLHTPNNSIRVVSTCSDGTIFIWRISEEIVAKMKSRCFDRDHRAQLMVVNGRSQEDILDDRRAALIQGVAAKPRLRRVSTATALQPMPSISQIARGERRTFSSMSPAEQKYEELYKKMTIPRTNPLLASRDASSTNNNVNNSNKVSTSPPPTRPAPERRSSVANIRNGPNISKRRVPEGKLQRLYNGIPTSGTRERTSSHVTPPTVNYSLMNRFGPSGLTQPRQGPPPALRMNSVLHHQRSREAINKIPQQQISLGVPNNQRPRSDGGLRGKRPDPLSQRASGSTLSHSSGETSSSHKDDVQKQKNVSTPSSPPAHKVTVPHPGDDEDNGEMDFLLVAGCSDCTTNFDENCQEASDGHDANEEDEDEDEEDEDEDEDEEEVIFIAPEQYEVGEAFEVTSNDIQENSGVMSSSENTEDGHTHHSQHQHPENEDDEGSSEENADDAILQTITSREAPRMTPSLSRSASVVTHVSRKSMARDETEQDRVHTEILSSLCGNGIIASTGRDTPGLCKLQRKLKKGHKRQSFTARYLLSLGGSGDGENKASPRASLNSIINTFQEMVQLTKATKESPTTPTTTAKMNDLFPDVSVPFEKKSPSIASMVVTMEKQKSADPLLGPITEIPDPIAMEQRTSVFPLRDGVPNYKSVDQLPTLLPTTATPALPVDMTERKLVVVGSVKETPIHVVANIQNDESLSIPTTTTVCYVDQVPALATIQKDDKYRASITTTTAAQIDQVSVPADPKVPVLANIQKHEKMCTSTTTTARSDTVPVSPLESMYPPDMPTVSTMEKKPIPSENTINHEHILGDLDGAAVLLDSVLGAYGFVDKASATTNADQTFLLAIADRLTGVVDRIHKAVPPSCSPPATADTTTTITTTAATTMTPSKSDKATPQDPATLALLDEYSIWLVQMVEQRLQSSK